MPTPFNPEEKYWFVLNYIRRSGGPTPQTDIDCFNKNSQRLELFAPIIRPAHRVNGKIVYRDTLLTYFYVFVRGTLEDVKELCINPANDLSLMLDRSSEHRYAMLTDAEMDNFKIIARAYTNTIPFFNISDIDLVEGDKVEVVDGQYAGLKGTFLPRSRSNKGNLVIEATGDMGAIVWDIDAKYVRIFGICSKHPPAVRPPRLIHPKTVPDTEKISQPAAAHRQRKIAADNIQPAYGSSDTGQPKA